MCGDGGVGEFGGAECFVGDDGVFGSVLPIATAFGVGAVGWVSIDEADGDEFDGEVEGFFGIVRVEFAECDGGEGDAADADLVPVVFSGEDVVVFEG